ncbi:MAG: AmmeMemoRadiSam system protein B [Candidatus Magasanikbacteria bacterium CG_4_9_14_0_2_um_filter_41_10]|nr:MAG: AmmeMemoRadiSam system protein B [Candidatus Magasanikbacteria bacterium CG1_02_41_34]PJC53531.1 MAG: AmmeMemoRadiSam system protein B [Candidatus Magasanikbacteria bacterium CG_4_9_14_0_2_um_filter_41_10]
MKKIVVYSTLFFGIIVLSVLSVCFAFLFTDITSVVPFIVYHTKNDDSQNMLTSAPWDIALYDSFYTRAALSPVEVTEKIKGGIVPHHLLGGYLVAQFFESLKKQHPSTIVLISPDHFSRGNSAVSTASATWNTPYGKVYADVALVKKMSTTSTITIREDVLSEEHGIYGIMPFIAKSLPQVHVIPLTLKVDMTEADITSLAQLLEDVLPKDAVIVSSVDFSHYQTSPVASFHDERTTDIIRSFNFARLDSLEIDSPPSVRLVMTLMELYGTQKVAYETSLNAAELVGDPNAQNITSYYTPYFVSGKPVETKTVSLLSVGDIMLDRSVALKMGSTGLSLVLDTLAGNEGRFFRGIDIISGNLEGPFVQKRIETSKEIAFRFDPRLAPQLRSYGFNMVTLANNHMLDMGRAGVPETEQVLKHSGIDFYGDAYVVSSSSLFYKEIHGKTIAFLGFNDTFNSLNEATAIALVEEAKEQSDVVVLNIHWGVEYQESSYPRQQYLAHTFIDHGVDLIIGHHPHVVQEMEIYNNRPIFYSLGNFIFDQYFSIPTQQELAVGTVFHDDGISLYLFPIVSEQSVLRQMTPREEDVFLAKFVDRSRLGSYTLDKKNHLFIPFLSAL